MLVGSVMIGWADGWGGGLGAIVGVGREFNGSSLVSGNGDI